MSFESFHFPPSVARAVRDLGFHEPTVIQEKTIPLILDGKDVVGQAQTGSGKTAAFGLPIIGKLNQRGVQMLILAPTRELCNQVSLSIASFGKHVPVRVTAVYGGVGMSPQIRGCRNAQVVVACPGRLLDLMERGAVDLRGVKYLIIDEADRMFDMGFIHDVERIVKQVPSNRQTLLFSATMPSQVRSLVQRYMRSPTFIETESKVDRSKLRESYFEVKQEDKFSILVHILKSEATGTALVFCGTRRIVEKITKGLKRNGIDALSIHGGLSQNRRDHAIESLHRKKASVVVATDIAARGLHVDDITHVINYDLPYVAEDYTHRIGRTARAGAEGDAISIVSSRDKSLLRPIMRLGHEPKKLAIPTFERVVLSSGRDGPSENESERPEGHYKFGQRRDRDDHRGSGGHSHKNSREMDRRHSGGFGSRSFGARSPRPAEVSSSDRPERSFHSDRPHPSHSDDRGHSRGFSRDRQSSFRSHDRPASRSFGQSHQRSDSHSFRRDSEGEGRSSSRSFQRDSAGESHSRPHSFRRESAGEGHSRSSSNSFHRDSDRPRASPAGHSSDRSDSPRGFHKGGSFPKKKFGSWKKKFH